VGSFEDVAARLAEVGRFFHARGWVLGTSGNLSAAISRDPLRIAITASGRDKGDLSLEHFLEIDETGAVVSGDGRPSDEAPLHLAIVGARGAGAVLHSHSVWGTVLSDSRAAEGGLRLSGWEMLKGLSGVTSHEHSEWLPILENSQDYARLSREVAAALRANPSSHGVLLRGHGLYAWGRGLDEARRHVEVLEFLMEVEGRRGGFGRGGA
jgi:methylthioribulose-1-phosphate dehydratase